MVSPLQTIINTRGGLLLLLLLLLLIHRLRFRLRGRRGLVTMQGLGSGVGTHDVFNLVVVRVEERVG
jgi:hypothetical protein